MEELEKYDYFINEVTQIFAGMFEDQKEYICCKDGCSLCCEKGMYPFSKLEFDYLKQAYDKLPQETKNKIISNIEELKKEYKGEHFMYQCPFLLNNRCSVYSNRGIVCRSFGLITENNEGNLTVPYCAGLGLNYSTIYEVDNRRISEEKIEELGYKNPPKPYKINRDTIMNLSLVKKLDLNFGESKMILEWMLDFLE